MRDFSDYQILQTLHDSPHSLVLRMRDHQTHQAVVLKIARDGADARPQSRQQLQAEFALLQLLDHPHLVKVQHLVRTPYGIGYSMLDAGGHSLADWLAQAPEGPLARYSERVQLALQLTEALEHVHQTGFSHRDISPANIVWNPTSRTLQLIDLGLAGRDGELSTESAQPGAPRGTPQYLAPEQTGRIGRAVDYRSDFYSLGATLYHLLCGTAPFAGSDYAQLVHAHIARTPQPAWERNPALPQALSKVLDKLLAKSPDERYQSTQGLRDDLRHCLQLVENNADDAAFVAGQTDRAVRLNLPLRLYGRDAERAQLNQAIALAATGLRQRVRVSGEPGAGKSFLVNACHQAVLQQGGWFAQGKFDIPQYRRPYAALHPLCQQLVLQALAGATQQTEQLRQDLRHTLGSSAAELQQVLPELQPLLGEGEAPTQLASDHNPHRIASAFQALIRLLQQHRKLLVFFIDDIQWADHASLSLLEALLVDPECRHVCLLVSARSGELEAGSKAEAFWQQLGKDTQGLTDIALSPLGSEPIAQWLSDALQKPTQELGALTELVQRKTGGNPFFIRQFMGLANVKNLFTYRQGWQWDVQALQALTATDNVVDLTIAHLQTLPAETCELLGAAACLGNECALALLARASDLDEGTLGARLQAALSTGAITLQDGYLRFSHDRITEALQTLYSPAQRQMWHALWGQLLAPSNAEGAQPFAQQLIDAVQQLNLGQAQLPAPWQSQLFALNRQAAACARTENATDLAAEFYAQAARLLPANAWQQDHANWLALHIDWAEVAFHAGQYAKAQELFGLLNSHASALEDRVRIATSEILFFEKTNLFTEAIERANQLLRELGVDFPATEAIDGPRSMAQLQRLKNNLQRVGIDRLPAIPGCINPRIGTVVDLLMSVTVPYWNTYPHAFPYVVMEAACLSLEHGAVAQTANALSFTASAICAGFQEYALGYQLGLAALSLPSGATSFHACQGRFLFHNMVRIYRDPLTAGMDELLDASYLGIETGNRQWASYCINHYCLRGLLAGLPLRQVQQGQEQLAPAMQRLQQEDAYGLFDSVRQVVVQLQLTEFDPQQLRGDFFDETKELPRYQKNSHFAAIGLAVTCKLLMLLVCDAFDSAARLADGYETLLNAPTGQLQTEFGLACAALAWLMRSQVSTSDTQRADQVIQRLTVLEQANSASFSPLRLLLTAVRQEREGVLHKAARTYDQAIDAATTIRMLHWMGLCNTLAARHWQARGHDRAAAGYTREAQQAWRDWGLTAKQFKAHTQAPSTHPRLTQTLAAPTTEGSGAYIDQLDFAAVVKMNQAIAAELVLDKLLATLLRLAMENAGANAGSLLLQTEGQLLLAARCDATTAEPQTLSPYQATWTLPEAAVRYSAGTQLPLLISDLQQDMAFGASGLTGALLIIPLVLQQKLRGLICLSHSSLPGAFLPQHLVLLQLLSSQMATAIDNAQLYRQILTLNAELEARVATRTTDLQHANSELSNTLDTLKRAQDQLVQSEKLAALGALVAGVAHELNTPIGTSLTVATSLEFRAQEFAALLDKGVRRSDLQSFVEDTRHGAEILTRNMARAGALVTGFKQVAVDQTSSQRRPFSLAALVSEIVLTLNPHIRKSGCTVTQDIDGTWQLDSYPGPLGQVVTNLLQNAIVHGFEDGQIAGTIALRAQSAGTGTVTLFVSDNGRGIQEVHLNRVFEPFFTTRLGQGGSGLGLHIVHNIVTGILGGRIEVTSAPEQGCTFSVTLPLVAPSPAAAAHTPGS